MQVSNGAPCDEGCHGTSSALAAARGPLAAARRRMHEISVIRGEFFRHGPWNGRPHAPASPTPWNSCVPRSPLRYGPTGSRPRSIPKRVGAPARAHPRTSRERWAPKRAGKPLVFPSSFAARAALTGNDGPAAWALRPSQEPSIECPGVSSNRPSIVRNGRPFHLVLAPRPPSHLSHLSHLSHPSAPSRGHSCSKRHNSSRGSRCFRCFRCTTRPSPRRTGTRPRGVLPWDVGRRGHGLEQ